MVATVQIIEKNTISATVTDKTNGTIRFKLADNATVDSNNPITIPASSSTWSWEKWIICNVTVAPSVQISNIRVYTGGANPWTGVNLWWKQVTAFATPAQGTSSVGYLGAFTFTSGAPKVLGSATYTGTGQFGDHLVALMEVTSTAVNGQLAGTTLTLAYDEI